MSPGYHGSKSNLLRRARLPVGAMLLASAVLFSVSTAQALVPAYQVEDLSNFATDIVIGTVTDRVSEWQDWPYGGRVIMTTCTVQVTDRLKGDGSATLSVVIPGGKVGDTTILASDCPDLVVGSQVALFLKKDLKGLPRYWIFGLERGAFTVDRGTATPMAAGLPPIPLGQLKARVTRALEIQR